LKKGFYIGLIGGGIMGLVVSLSMDLLLGSSLGGGWKDAVAHDLGSLLGHAVNRDSLIVLVGVIVVMAFISAFGAMIGGIFGIFVVRLISFLTKGG
jgi:hypothetical protein